MSDIHRPQAHRTPAFRVGQWLAEPVLNRLTAGDTVLRMRPQLMDVLVCLARHQGRVVLKDELLAEVWPDRVITESGMVRCIAELRQLLGDQSKDPAYIETIAKRGYRLLADVEWVADPPAGGTAVAGTGTLQTGSETVGSDGGPPAGEPAAAGGPGVGPIRRRWWFAVAAAAAVVLLVAAFLAWRRTPAPLTEKDVAVLAFENLTGNSMFDDTLPLALAIHLEQSPYLRMLSAERVREILGQMKRPPGQALTKALGLEVCERAGAAALIVGSVTPLGRRFVIGIEASACVGGDVIARQQVEVDGADQILSGLGRAASQLRRTLGESRDSIAEYDVPITEGTTASLDALRALRHGDAARERGQVTEALRYYREAVEKDPDFALAQLRLGAFALDQHFEPEGVAALERAYASRDRVTFPERLEIDLVYHSSLTGDQTRVTEALETMRRVYPLRLVARRRLANHYVSTGRLPEALAEALEARRLEPDHAGAYSVLGRAYLVNNRPADARVVFEEAIARNLANDATHAGLLHIGFQTADADLIARERTWASTRAEAQPAVLEAEAEEAVWRGRLADSLTFLDRYQALCRQRNAEFRWIVLELRKARYEALCGYSARAMDRVGRQLARGDAMGPELKTDALKVAVSAGDTARVAAILAELDALRWPKAQEPFAGFVLSYRAALDTDQGRPRQALDRLAPMIPFELGLNWGFIPLYERARAHLKTGEWDQARAACQKMLDHPGVFSGQKLLPLAQLGLARALAAGGKTPESRAAYEAFFLLWKDADADLPLLADARREFAALPLR